MYDLSCSTVNNNKIKTEISDDIKNYVQKYNHMFDFISCLIFNEISDVKQYKKYASILTLADEWKEPISLKFASILFFALCNNCNSERNVLITNFSQASTLFDESENDYTKILKEDKDGAKRYEEFKTSFSFLIDGCTLTFKIPVRFLKVKEQNLRMLDQRFKPLLIIGEAEYEIPWNKFIIFFKGNKKISVTSTEKISSLFVADNKNLVEILENIGYLLDRNFDLENELTNKIIIFDDEIKKIKIIKGETNSVFWKNNILLPNVNYLIVNNKGTLMLYKIN